MWFGFVCSTVGFLKMLMDCVRIPSSHSWLTSTGLPKRVFKVYTHRTDEHVQQLQAVCRYAACSGTSCQPLLARSRALLPLPVFPPCHPLWATPAHGLVISFSIMDINITLQLALASEVVFPHFHALIISGLIGWNDTSLWQIFYNKLLQFLQ